MKKYRLLSFLVYLCAGLLLSACNDDTLGLQPVDVGTRTILPGSPTPKKTIPAPAPTPYLPPGYTPVSKRPDGSPIITVEVDPFSKAGYDISPYIYGMAGGDEADPNYSANLKTPLFRWGGNPATRYNWVLGNAWNAARDWEFRNTDYGQPKRDIAGDSIKSAQKLGAAFLLTIPTIGWVAKNTDQNIHSLNVPAHGGPPIAPGSEAIAGYDPTANRALTSVKSMARKNADFVEKPNPNSPVVYQDEWVASLVKQFGPASEGGVKFYAMDNEPDLWSEVHTDIHPTRVGYDEALARFEEYASAVKDVDPTAQITGPVSSGWNAYLFSELDRGDDNFKSLPDRTAHGNVAFIPWFLDQLRNYEAKNGKRILDVLDVHYYPQATGLYNSDKTDPDSAALRLRSTRSLWDDSYIDESWIGTQIRLIPRMREWINTYYPATKLGISEWNFGADNTLNGALTIATVLGIFGREGVYLAAYWRFPPKDSPGYYAFKLYTNFDGKGSTFGDKSIPVKVSDDQNISSFAALDTKTGRMRLIIINNNPNKEQQVRLQFPKLLPNQAAYVYQLSAKTGNKLQAQNPIAVTEDIELDLMIPAYSATLLDMQPPSGN
jgi:hypothetical protein